MAHEPAMDPIDLNLLPALDALLREGSVTGAARRLGLSASAMSRTLARLRRATGDPLLVQAGRGMVATPHAEALAGRLPGLLRAAQAVLRPAEGAFDPATLDRVFTIRAGEGFVEMMGAPLIAAIGGEAPHAALRFVAKPDKDAGPLRAGDIDLEIGVLGSSAPELRTRLLIRDRLVGVARADHPLFDRAAIDAPAYAACRHVLPSRRGRMRDAIDQALDGLGLSRRVAMVVPTYPDAMRVVQRSDLVTAVPGSCLGHALAPDHAARMGLRAFDLPVPVEDFPVSVIWHPRFEADPAHRWLRGMIVAWCGKAWPISPAA
jgi:DNA-binding transcriptional LysR family regulator